MCADADVGCSTEFVPVPSEGILGELSAEDVAKLILAGRKGHPITTSEQSPWCATCMSPAPCLILRLAETLEREIEAQREYHRAVLEQGQTFTAALASANARVEVAEQALVESEVGAAALRQMALALIYVDGPEVRETARRELDNIQAGSEFIAQLEATKRALAESERARLAYAEQAKREFERLTGELQEAKEAAIAEAALVDLATKERDAAIAECARLSESIRKWKQAADHANDTLGDMTYELVSERDAALAECMQLREMVRKYKEFEDA